jgi:hypothetical protein
MNSDLQKKKKVRIWQMCKISYQKRITLKRELYRNACSNNKRHQKHLRKSYDKLVFFAWRNSRVETKYWEGFHQSKTHLLVWERGMKIILLRCHAYLVFERVTTFNLFINAVFVNGHWRNLTASDISVPDTLEGRFCNLTWNITEINHQR